MYAARRSKRKKIDHPPKGSKDVADGVAGVVHNILENSDYYGTVTVGRAR